MCWGLAASPAQHPDDTAGGDGRGWAGQRAGHVAAHTRQYEFALEIQPNATTSEIVMDALRGANPLLAPGVLALAAILAIAATYYHPALHQDEQMAEMPVGFTNHPATPARR